MTQHRYILEPYKGMNTRYRCPHCQHRNKTFSLYIDTGTGEQIHPTVGRCNRESNCGYHYTPKQYFQDNKISSDSPRFQGYNRQKRVTPTPKQVTFIPVEVFKASLKDYEKNHFAKFLTALFGEEVASGLIGKYFIGTSKHWSQATVFWQIDLKGKIRTGKIMLYSPITGKRIKEPINHITWAHKALKLSEFDLRQCFFGEHLLRDTTKPVAIVESEKTAVIASVYLPKFIWIAVGSLTNLQAEKCVVLKGRTVVLFPDLNGFEKWNNQAKKLSHLGTFIVSNLLESKATETERKQGLDLVDYLIKFDHREFVQQEPEPLPSPPPPANEPLIEISNVENTNYFHNPEAPVPGNWDQQIMALETYFTGIILPTEPIKLNQCCTVTNVSLFIESHLSMVKANTGKRSFAQYLNRLNELKENLPTNLNV